jgi:hypothetical protein
VKLLNGHLLIEDKAYLIIKVSSSESSSISGSDWTMSFSSIFASESELVLNSIVLFLGFDDLNLLSAFLLLALDCEPE